VYPISNFITKQVYYCKDYFVINMPWELASRCYWTVSQEETFQVWTGQVVLRHEEWVQSITQWRTIQSILRVSIRFSKFVSVQTTSSVYNSPTLQAAVTKQIVAIDRSDPARVELVSILPWPYKLDVTNGNWVVGIVPKNPDGSTKYSNITLSSTDCNSTQGIQCKQRWNHLLTLNDKTCTLTGAYATNYSLICSTGSDANSCPLTQQDKNVAIQYSLTSEDFCATIQVDVGLTAVMTSFEDSGFTTPKTAYIVDRVAYFKIVITSELGSVIQFQASKITQIQFIVKADGSVAGAIEIYNQGPSVDCVSTNCNVTIITSPNTNECDFSVAITSALINLSGEAAVGNPVLKANSKVTYTLNANVQIAYLDTSATKKRGYMGVLGESASSQSRSSSALDIASIQGANSPTTALTSPTTASTSSHTGSATSLIVSLFLLFTIFIIV